MKTRTTVLNEADITALMEQAAEMARVYDAENERNPRDAYDYGGVESLALQILEQRNYFIAVDISPIRGDVRLRGREGHLAADGTMFAETGTVTYDLKNFKRPAVASFARYLCGALCRRANNGIPDLREIMSPRVEVNAGATKRRIEKYGGN